MSEPPYSPMLDVEQKHKLSFDGCTIIPRPNEDFEDDENGVLSFDGYAIIPKEMYKMLRGPGYRKHWETKDGDNSVILVK